jgi:hypothetical protein
MLALLLGIGVPTPIQAQDTTASPSAEKSAPGQAPSSTTSGGGYYIPDLSHAIRAFPHVLPKIGLFDTDTIGPLLDAYAVVEGRSEAFVMMDGAQATNAPFGRRAIYMPASKVQYIQPIDQKTSNYVQAAMAKLDSFLGKR